MVRQIRQHDELFDGLITSTTTAGKPDFIEAYAAKYKCIMIYRRNQATVLESVST